MPAINSNAVISTSADRGQAAPLRRVSRDAAEDRLPQQLMASEAGEAQYLIGLVEGLL